MNPVLMRLSVAVLLIFVFPGQMKPVYRYFARRCIAGSVFEKSQCSETGGQRLLEKENPIEGEAGSVG